MDIIGDLVAAKISYHIFKKYCFERPFMILLYPIWISKTKAMVLKFSVLEIYLVTDLR